MLLLRAVLNIIVRNASPRGPMCFRCLIFNLAGPCDCELFGETIRNVFGCSCDFVVESYGCV